MVRNAFGNRVPTLASESVYYICDAFVTDCEKKHVDEIMELKKEEITSLHSKITTLEDDLRKARQEASEYQHLCQQMEKELKELKNNEQQEHAFRYSTNKLHGEMCKILSLMYVKVLSVFPELEAASPRSTSGIQALCSFHIALEKTKTVLQHCAKCSKIYLAITGDFVVLKFEKARSALEDGLRKVEDIVPKTIGCQLE